MKESIFIGNWKNPKTTTQGIYQFSITKSEQGMDIEVEGVAEGRIPGKWGKQALALYNNNPDERDPVAFQATYTIGGLELQLAGNINKGLIIIALYARQLASTDQADFFIREFYFKKK